MIYVSLYNDFLTVVDRIVADHYDGNYNYFFWCAHYCADIDVRDVMTDDERAVFDEMGDLSDFVDCVTYNDFHSDAVYAEWMGWVTADHDTMTDDEIAAFEEWLNSF